MADEVELLNLSHLADSCLALSGVQGRLIRRGQTEARSLLQRTGEPPCLAMVMLGRKWGFVGKDGEFVVEPVYGSVRRYKSGLATFSYSSDASNSLWGYLDPTGKVAISPQFEGAGDFSEGFAWVKRQGKFGFVRRDGSLSVEPQFEFASSFKDGTAFVRTGAHKRLVDSSGSILGQCFDELQGLGGAQALAAKTGSNWGFVNRRGEILLEPKFDYVRALDGGGGWSAAVGDRNFLIDLGGCVVTEVKGGSIVRYSHGILTVYSGGCRSFVDGVGRVLLRWDPGLKNVGAFREGVCLVRGSGDPAFYIDTTGKRLTGESLRATAEFREGRGIVSNGIRFGYIDNSGRPLTDVVFKEAWPFADGFAQVRTDDDSLGWLDLSCRLIKEPRFPEFGQARMRIRPFDEPWSWANPPQAYNDTRFQEGLCRVKAEGRWGFVDTRCRVVVEPKFARAANFSCGLAAVEGENGKWGYIDRSGHVIIPPQFERAKGFYRADSEFGGPLTEWEDWRPLRCAQSPIVS